MALCKRFVRHLRSLMFELDAMCFPTADNCRQNQDASCSKQFGCLLTMWNELMVNSNFTGQHTERLIGCQMPPAQQCHARTSLQRIGLPCSVTCHERCCGQMYIKVDLISPGSSYEMPVSPAQQYYDTKWLQGLAMFRGP